MRHDEHDDKANLRDEDEPEANVRQGGYPPTPWWPSDETEDEDEPTSEQEPVEGPAPVIAPERSFTARGGNVFDPTGRRVFRFTTRREAEAKARELDGER